MVVVLYCSIRLPFDILFKDHTVFVSVICYFIVYPYFIGIEDIPILIIEENIDVSIKLMLVLHFFCFLLFLREKSIIILVRRRNDHN